MKKNHFLLLLLAVLCLSGLTACKKTTYLKTDTNSIKTSLKGSNGDIQLSSDGTEMEVVHQPDWVNVTITDNTLHYEVKENTDRRHRVDSIVVKNGDLTSSILVSQAYQATYLTVDSTKVTLPVEGGAICLNVDTDGDSPIRLESPLGNNNEQLATIEGNVVTIKATKNPGKQAWTKTIVLRCDDQMTEIEVSQESNSCTNCKGSGYLNQTCSVCGGYGTRACCNYTGKMRCPKCKGSGRKK